MRATTRTELDKIKDPTDRARIATAIAHSGIGETYHAYAIRCLRHRLGHKDRHDKRVALPVPPATLRRGETDYIDTTIRRLRP